MRVALVVVAVLCVGCAPTVDGPVEKQRAADTTDAARLTTQLTALPGVARAEVVLTRSVRDPLSTLTPPHPAASVLLVVDDRADRPHLEATAKTLTRALAGIEPVVVVEVGVHRPALASLGPFTVTASSKPALKAALAVALALVVLLASWLAWTLRPQRRGNSAQ